MTTVVATLEVMVADHRLTSEGAPCSVKKIHRIGDALYGIAGGIFPAMAFIHWMRTGGGNLTTLYAVFGESVEARSSFTVLELSHAGLALIDGWGMRVPLYDKRYGIGTGAQAPLALMDKGLPPQEAIHASPTLDECSGINAGEPEVEWLLPPELTFPEIKQPKRRK